MSFSKSLREKVLLWCDRHCCLCKKPCDVFIEVHHIAPEGTGGSDEEDNAIPLCFECHGRVSHYDPKQPIGNMFKPDELKKRRDQIYDEFTRHLVPALSYKVHQSGRKLPDVGFSMTHLGDAPPVQVIVTLDTYIGGTLENIDDTDNLYRGGMRWNLNPKEGVNGHYRITEKASNDDIDLRVGLELVVYDCYDRPHKLLPVTYVYGHDKKEWWLDPVDPKRSYKRS